MKKSETERNNGLVEIPPFDFDHSQANKFAAQYDQNAQVVILNSESETLIKLEADVARYFPDSQSVNDALRALIAAFSTLRVPSVS
jgi:hypothetical protein